MGKAVHTWTERVQIIRSEASAQSQAAALERRLEKAEAAVRGLTPPPGPGRTQFTTGWELERAVAAVLAEHQVEGLLEVSWERQETSRTQYVGRGRGGPNRPKTTEWDIRYQITTVRRDEAAIRTPGGADGLAGAGDQRPGLAAVVGGGAVDVPWGLVWRDPASIGEASAGLLGAVRGGIHTVSHKFQLSTLSIRERAVLQVGSSHFSWQLRYSPW